MRTAFLAGASGAVGRTIVRLAAREEELRVVPHYRRPPDTKVDGAAVFALDDRPALVAALRGATTVIQCIGTMRKRFAKGDTYETSDIGTTLSLVQAAREAGTIDHLVLLSSVGAGRPLGAYLKAKARAEAIVTESTIPFTIFRPSAFNGEGHKAPRMDFLKRIPVLAAYAPITVEDLARALLRAAAARDPLDSILESHSLFDLVDWAR